MRRRLPETPVIIPVTFYWHGGESGLLGVSLYRLSLLDTLPAAAFLSPCAIARYGAVGAPGSDVGLSPRREASPWSSQTLLGPSGKLYHAAAVVTL